MFHKSSVRFDERELQSQFLTGQMRSPALAQVGERILFMNAVMGHCTGSGYSCTNHMCFYLIFVWIRHAIGRAPYCLS